MASTMLARESNGNNFWEDDCAEYKEGLQHLRWAPDAEPMVGAEGKSSETLENLAKLREDLRTKI